MIFEKILYKCLFSENLYEVFTKWSLTNSNIVDFLMESHTHFDPM